MMAAQPKNPFVSSVADVIEELVGEPHFTVAFLEDATYYLGMLSINWTYFLNTGNLAPVRLESTIIKTDCYKSWLVFISSWDVKVCTLSRRRVPSQNPFNLI